jgi:NADH pyrophosphatase NudC (nudix superfamily)
MNFGGNMTKQVCVWIYDDLDDYWETLCGEAFTLNVGSPSENKMKFCPYCGRRLKEKKHD